MSEYKEMTRRELIALPMDERRKVLKEQAEQFMLDNPDYYESESVVIGQTANYDFLMTPPYIERD